MKDDTARAFEEIRLAVAAHLGADPSEVTMAISRPHEPGEPGADNTSCMRCHETYFDESGCDPCPHCGASYFDQIFPGCWREPRLRKLKRRRRAARRTLAAGVRTGIRRPGDFDDLLHRAWRELDEATFDAALAERRRRAAMLRYSFLVRFVRGVEGEEGSA